MGLCDQLQATQAERETHRGCLVNSSVRGLVELMRRFLDSGFLRGKPVLACSNEVGHRPVSKECVELGGSGDLAEQIVADEQVDAQLERSDQARRATAKGDLRADQASQQLLGAEGRWEVPTSWRWRGLADLVLFIDYRGMTPAKTSSGVPLITAKNVRRGFISVMPEEFLSEADYPRWMTRGVPEAGDILFTTEAPMGNAAVVRSVERFALGSASNLFSWLRRNRSGVLDHSTPRLRFGPSWKRHRLA